MSIAYFDSETVRKIIDDNKILSIYFCCLTYVHTTDINKHKVYSSLSSTELRDYVNFLKGENIGCYRFLDGVSFHKINAKLENGKISTNGTVKKSVMNEINPNTKFNFDRNLKFDFVFENLSDVILAEKLNSVIIETFSSSFFELWMARSSGEIIDLGKIISSKFIQSYFEFCDKEKILVDFCLLDEMFKYDISWKVKMYLGVEKATSLICSYSEMLMITNHNKNYMLVIKNILILQSCFSEITNFTGEIECIIPVKKLSIGGTFFDDQESFLFDKIDICTKEKFISNIQKKGIFLTHQTSVSEIELELLTRWFKFILSYYNQELIEKYQVLMNKYKMNKKVIELLKN